MICKYCGADIQEGATFCTSCGSAVEPSQTMRVSVEENVTVENNLENESKGSKGLGIASMCCAIVGAIASFVGLCCSAIPGDILLIVALVLGIVSMRKAKRYGQKTSGFTKAGFIISVVMLSIRLLWIVALLVIYFVWGASYFSLLGLISL